jgi:hypothetical protein
VNILISLNLGAHQSWVVDRISIVGPINRADDDKEWMMPIDPVAENTIEDENDADFELDDLFKEPNNRSMAAVIAHSQQLIFVDERIKEYFLSKAKELLKRNQWDD